MFIAQHIENGNQALAPCIFAEYLGNFLTAQRRTLCDSLKCVSRKVGE